MGHTTAYSYYARRSEKPSALGRQLLRDAVSVRQAQRAASYWRQRFGALLIILALLASVWSMLALDTTPVIKSAEPNGLAFLHSSTQYERTAEELLGLSILNRNKITVDTRTIAAGLRRRYPELSVVSITLPLFGQHPIIYIAQSDPTLLLTATDGKSYVIDASGRAIAPGSAAPTSLHLLPVHDNSGQVIRLGQPAVPSTTVDFIKVIYFQLAQRQVQIGYFILPAASSELDVKLATYQYIVRCNVASGTALEQAGTFLAMLQYLEGRGITPSQYVDVRLDGRAYYK